MFIECWGRQSALYLWSFLLCCLYIDVKENIICQNLRFFLLFIKLAVPETKCIVNNLKRQLSRGDCSYSLCIRANNIINY